MSKRLVASFLTAVSLVAVPALLGCASAPPSPAATAAPSATAHTASARPAATAASPTASARPAAKAKPAMRLVFNATFPGTKLNTKIWDTCYPWAPEPSKGCTNFNNREYQWYIRSQVRVYGGALHLVARPLRTTGLSKTGGKKIYSCRSGMVTTHPGFNFEYGKITVVAQMPKGNGLWSALWIAASNFQWPPEADLLEHWGAPMSLTGTFFHAVGAALKNHPKTANLTVGWHSYTLIWSSSRMTWYIDGHKVWAVGGHTPHQSMYFTANVADYLPVTAHSGNCNGTMLIRSVRVWK